MSNITEKPKVRSMAELVISTPKGRNYVWFYRLENGDILKETKRNDEYFKTIIPQAEYNPTNEIIALKKWKVSVHRVEGDEGKWIYLVGDGPEDIPPYKALE
tara:strand:- start:560 stop:865 length:306 start_codon:yes stop_codon:yes gene_type:complete